MGLAGFEPQIAPETVLVLGERPHGHQAGDEEAELGEPRGVGGHATSLCPLARGAAAPSGRAGRTA